MIRQNNLLLDKLFLTSEIIILLNRINKLLVIPIFFALISGCSGRILSGAGPTVNAVTDLQQSIEGNYSIIDLDAQTIGPYRRLPEAAPNSRVIQPDVPAIILMPGDVVKITVSDSAVNSSLFAPLASGGTSFSNIRINDKGQINLPYAGNMKANGLTLEQLAVLIQGRLKRTATDPQVMVELTGDVSGSVLVAGAVKAPGRFSALQGPLTLLDAINRAGGPILEPHLTNVIVRNGETSQTYSYEQILAGDNLVLTPRSEVILERAPKRFVAMGAVSRPGLMDLPSNNPSLLEVLGTAGWLRESTADPSGVFVFRIEASASYSQPKAKVFRLDLSNPAAVFLARQFLVQPEDAIYVTNAAVYEWQKIISPILQVLILGNTVTNANFM